jgi:hypothetical protein
MTAQIGVDQWDGGGDKGEEDEETDVGFGGTERAAQEEASDTRRRCGRTGKIQRSSTKGCWLERMVVIKMGGRETTR